MIIKALLIAAVLGAGWWLLRGQQRGRQLAMTRMITGGLTVAAIAAVLAPNALTDIANALGVGRGADLVLYALVVVFAFSTIATALRMRRLEARLSELTRGQALLAAQMEMRETRVHE
ncbi:hypothetical protein JCM18899A_17430 [Nocardioides sp. AN3]